MDEELEKQKYRTIIKHLYIINNKINNYQNNLSSLKSSTDNIKIDNISLGKKEISNISNSLASVSDKIVNRIIPSLYNKC